ncbi:MAG: hybrid sensor histidine kinase/response regulator [Opitutales bacterium]
MHSLYNYKQFAVLYVDDEETSLKYFSLAFGKRFRVMTALNAEEGFRIMSDNKDEIGVVISDQRMPGEKGVQLLEKVRQLRHRTIRILVTAYADMDAAIEAVNAGAISKYITKPWDIKHMEMIIEKSLELYILETDRERLLQEKISTLQSKVDGDRVVNLGTAAAGLGHYVGNSLVAVRTFLDMAPAKLREEKIDVEKMDNQFFWNDFYQQAQEQLQRISLLLGDIGNAIENPFSSNSSQVQLDEVAKEALLKVREKLDGKKISVDLQFEPLLPQLSGHRSQFEKLFELLFEEEADNLPAGSHIRLQARRLYSEMEGGEAVEIKVEDNGPLPFQENLETLFDPFCVRNGNPRNFGISLMTCYLITHRHGGKIGVHHGEMGGVVLTFTFPTTPPARPSAEEERDFLFKLPIKEAHWKKLRAGTA